MTDSPTLHPTDGPRIALDARYIRAPFSGIARHTQNLLVGLRQIDNLETILIIIDDQTMIDDAIRNDDRFQILHVTARPTSILGQMRLARSLRRMGVQLLHSPDAFGPISAPGLLQVVTLADVIPLVCRHQLGRSRKAQLSFLWRAWLKRQCQTADRVVTVSEHSAKDIGRELGVPESHIAVIYNSIPDVSDAHAATKTGDHKHDESVRNILCTGRRDPYKNLVGLIRAFAVVHDAQPDTRLVIVGSRDDRYPEAEQEIESHNLGDAVVVTGFVEEDELVRLYDNAALFAFPTLYEGFGLPPLESMRHDVPVVSSNRACMPEVLGEAALFADPTDADAFGHAILEVLQKPQLAQDLIERGRQQVRRYRPETQAQQTLDLWHDMLTQS